MATSAAAEEDFSFPITTTDSPPQFIESPPLWRSSSSTATATVSPGEKPETSKGKEVQDEEELKLCSFQEVKARSVDKIMSSSRDDEDEDEDKMDMLWEDLNDEFSRIGCGINKAQIHSDVSLPGKEVKISCVKALKLSKANRNMFDGKKPSIIVFIKVLKKVFLMQNSHRTIKKHAW